MIWLIILLILIQTVSINYLAKRFKFSKSRKFWLFYIVLLIVFVISYYLVKPVISFNLINGLIGGLICFLIYTIPYAITEINTGISKFTWLEFLQDLFVVGPLEELVFRGLLLTTLLPLGVLQAIIISSLIFSIWHWNKQKEVLAGGFIAGITLSIAFLFFNSIIASSLLHSSLNMMDYTLKPLFKKLKRKK